MADHHSLTIQHTAKPRLVPIRKHFARQETPPHAARSVSMTYTRGMHATFRLQCDSKSQVVRGFAPWAEYQTRRISAEPTLTLSDNQRKLRHASLERGVAGAIGSWSLPCGRACFTDLPYGMRYRHSPPGRSVYS